MILLKTSHLNSSSILLFHGHDSIKAELSLQAEALALELKALWVSLSNASRSDAPQHSSASGTGTPMHTGSHGELPLELCQLFLVKLNRACVVFISCADQLEENCCSLNDEIAKDKDIYRDSTGYRLENVRQIYFATHSTSHMNLIF